MTEPSSILVVRRDNIGDLVCTTPLFTALRRRFPRAWIGAMVNSYNAEVLAGNPDLDEVVVYTKLKHLDPGESAAKALKRRVADLWRLRRQKLEYVLLATPDFVPRTVQLARLLGARRVVGFSDGSPAARRLDLSVPLAQLRDLHEVERVFTLARHLGIEDAIPPLKVVPMNDTVAKASAAFEGRPGLKVAVQISTRRPAQRWPIERFVELVQRLQAGGAHCLLLWSPGAPDHPRHPGDDDKAAEIVQRLAGVAPVAAYRAGPLAELIGALAACDAVITSDGGAMHLAAALGKPIVCFFGDMPPARWRPWGVPHRVLQPQSGQVADLPVDEVVAALSTLVAFPASGPQGRSREGGNSGSHESAAF